MEACWMSAVSLPVCWHACRLSADVPGLQVVCCSSIHKFKIPQFGRSQDVRCCCCSCLQACLPASGSLPSAAAGDDVSECVAAAWQLQVHACALHILLLELLSVQVGAFGVACCSLESLSVKL
jgi:hypothetical protein